MLLLCVLTPSAPGPLADVKKARSLGGWSALGLGNPHYCARGLGIARRTVGLRACSGQSLLVLLLYVLTPSAPGPLAAWMGCDYRWRHGGPKGSRLSGSRSRLVGGHESGRPHACLSFGSLFSLSSLSSPSLLPLPLPLSLSPLHFDGASRAWTIPGDRWGVPLARLHDAPERASLICR